MPQRRLIQPKVLSGKGQQSPRLRLICFPYAGGSASVFNGWRDWLARDIEMLCPELPGRGSRIQESPFTDFAALIDALRHELRSFLDLPIAFFGHSMGALIAFELAKELRQLQLREPLHIFVSAHCAPQVRTADSPIHRLPDAEFLSELGRRYGSVTRLLQHSELSEVFVPLLRADFSVCESYVYRVRPPLDCPISAFGGSSDTRPSAKQLAAWQVHTRDRFRLQVFPGDHFYLHDARPSLLRIINQQLRQALGDDRPLVRRLPPAQPSRNARPSTVSTRVAGIPGPLFILALPRSFSSVTCAMLGQHPQMYSLPETNLAVADTMDEWWGQSRLGMEYPRHGLLRVVAQVYFGGQTEATVELAEGWIRRRAHFSTGYLLETIADKLRPLMVVEKSPHIVRQAEFMKRLYRLFPQAKFIHLVRHPCGQGKSMMQFYQRKKARGPMQPSHWLNAMMTVSTTRDERGQDSHLDPQRAWYVFNNNVCQFLRTIPKEQQMIIRGEDILGKPDESLVRIASWLGLRSDAEAIDAMKHPERSPYANFGPCGARYGNDPFFLNDPVLQPARVRPQSLGPPAGWYADGYGFLPEVRQLAEQFGYE